MIKAKIPGTACTHRVLVLAGYAFTSVGIYFPGVHVLVFGIIKKNRGPNKYSPGACPRRVGIYFHVGIYLPARHALLFGMIKNKNSRPQHVLTGYLYSPGRHLLSCWLGHVR